MDLKHTGNQNSGYTLIELLVVISIIGFLAAMILVSLQSSSAKARDARRLSDMHEIQTALELYRSDAGGYPSSLTFDGSSTLTCGSNLFLNPLPKDPGFNTYTYTALGATSTTTCSGGSGNVNASYQVVFTTEQATSLGTPSAHTLDTNGIR